jgi:maleate isomerase
MMTTQHRTHRVGMIVPSSNTTMETEIPELLRRQQAASGDRFSFHSARLRLQQVTPEALQKMNEAADGAVDLLCDAQVDAIVYACLVAVMFGGSRCIPQTQAQLAARAAATDRKPPPVVTSAGALVGALEHLNAGRITMIAPYRKSITARVAATLAECGILVVQSRSLEVVDNLHVGRLDPLKLLALAAQLDFSGSDALVLSACVQMPSLDVIEDAEQRFGLPVVSAATASAFDLLGRLGIAPQIDNAGTLLRGRRAVLS